MTVTSDCPKRWKVFYLCSERISKVYPSLQSTLSEVNRVDLLLDEYQLLLLKDVVNQLEPFRMLTNMLCANTCFTINHYLLMKKLLTAKLEKEVEITEASNTAVIGAFRKNLCDHFAKFKLPKNIAKLALTASYLSPEHLVNELRFEPDIRPFIKPFIKNLVELLNDIRGTYIPETQMIGPSQPPVILTPNLPKDANNNPNDANKNPYWKLFRPDGLPKNTTPPQPKIRKPLEEVITAEVEAYTSYCLQNIDAIEHDLEHNKEGFNVSMWWATHHTNYPNMAVVKNIMCIPATSANCERAFSTLTDVVTDKRNKLKGETTEMLTFLKHNKDLIPEYTENIKPQTRSEINNNASSSQDNQEDVDENVDEPLPDLEQMSP